MRGTWNSELYSRLAASLNIDTMEINILAFGQIADIAGRNCWKEKDITSTDLLKMKLHQQYPQLIHLNYLIAVDKTVVQENTVLSDYSTVALLPPYSGG